MPVGKGSIARATNASINNHSSVVMSAKKMPDILTEIPLKQIAALPKKWMKRPEGNHSVKELMTSIQTYGMIEPVILRRVSDSQFQLLSGYRRLQAVKEIGMETITSRIVEDLNEEEAISIYHDLHRTMDENNSNNIHEYKFQAVTTISKDMPDYLL